MSVNLRNIVGNSELKERISDEINNKIFSHAYIIEGRAGSGRHTLALSISAALSCLSKGEIPCGTCKNCQKILSGKSPDTVTLGLENDKVTIGVESIRRIKEDMALAPNDLDVKVYIIEDADKMTVQAQNAFLLSLEEPPSYVVFFLICENSNLLLETVRSRAPILRLQRLCDDMVEKYLLQNDKRAGQLKDEDATAFQTLIFASDGCIGKAISLLDAKKRKALFEEREIAKKILSLLSCPSRSDIPEFISSLGNKRADILRCLISSQYAVRDLMLLKKTDTAPLCFFPNREEAQELSTHYTSDSLISLYDALRGASDELEANSNVRLTLLNMVQKAGLI